MSDPLLIACPTDVKNLLKVAAAHGRGEMDAADAEVRNKSFYYRFERWILPVIVMLTGLLIVVYGGQLLVEHGAEWSASLNGAISSLFG